MDNGNIVIQRSDNANPQLILSGDNQGFGYNIYMDDIGDGNLHLEYTSLSVRGLTVSQSNTVGIGTPTPRAPLNVMTYAAGLTEVIRLSGGNGTIGSGPVLSFQSTYNPNATSYPNWRLAEIAAEYKGSYGGDLIFKTNVSGSGSDIPLEKMRLTNDGNVGIGTVGVTPKARLHVIGRTMIQDGHLTVIQTTSPTIALNTPTYAGTATLSSYSTDIAGSFIVTVTTAGCAGCAIATVNFATAFAVAPIVVISPNNLYGSIRMSGFQIYATATTTGFSIYSNAFPTNSNAMGFNYIVIENN